MGISSNKLKDLQDKATRQAYSLVATDLVVYCLGVIDGEISGFETSYTPEMASAAEELETALQTAGIDDQCEALQSFFFSTFSHKRRGKAEKYIFPPYSFLVKYAFTEDGSLQSCNRFTQSFSKIIFFARAAIFKHTISDSIRDNKGFFE